MKKNLLIAAALFWGTAAFAQKNENAPAPPPPPAKLQQPSAPPSPPKAPDAKIGERKYDAFLQRNPQVKSVNWSSAESVHVYLKSGKEEVYHLNNLKEAKIFQEKYGELPPPPPPPPIAPPPPPRDINS